MATLKFRDQDGAWQYAPSLKFKNADKVFQITNGLKYKDKNGVWHKVNICGSKAIDPVFANNTWEDVIKACQTGNVPDTWNIGDQMVMSINGTDYAFDIIGKNHDDYADGSGKAPLTFQMHDCYKTGYPMKNSQSNVGGWRDSVMRTTYLPEILSLMPLKVQNAIKEVNKSTSAGGQSASMYTTSDKLFLLSEVEVFGTYANSIAGEGNQYEYYKNDNSKIKNANGSNRIWWERSPHKSSSSVFCGVDRNGNASSYYANNSNFVSFAFCF